MASNEIRLSNYQLASGRFIGCSQIPYASDIHDQDIKAMQRMYGQGGQPTPPSHTSRTSNDVHPWSGMALRHSASSVVPSVL